MIPLSLRLSLVLAGALGVAAWLVAPQAIMAAHWLAAEDDPVALAELGLDRNFDARVAGREIAAAAAAGDVELAESFVELARERNIAVDPALLARVAAEGSAPAATAHGAGQFVRGFITGEPDDLASLVGTATGARSGFAARANAVREAGRPAPGGGAAGWILGWGWVGPAVTAGTDASAGMGTPARLGWSVVKAARKTGRMGVQLSAAVTRAVRETFDAAALRRGFTRAALMRPVLALRAAREAVKVDKAGGLLHLARDIGRVQGKAGTRTALDGLKLADTPKDIARLARLAEAKGTKTRAIIKLLGRGAIMLTAGVAHLAAWLLSALVNLIWLCAVLKRAAERATLHVIRRRKAARLPQPDAVREAFAPAAAAV